MWNRDWFLTHVLNFVYDDPLYTKNITESIDL